jgi:DNA-binding NarL/FixJ family response regulator
MKIVIAEDSVLLRAGLVRLLADSGAEIVGEAADAAALLAAVDESRPDIVITDVRMPPTHTDEGIRAALSIRKNHPQVAILVLSQYVEQYHATELLSGDNAGVGYLLKDRVADVDDFIASVRRVAAGGTALDSEVVSQLLTHTRQKQPLDSLTPREMDVLRLMAEGRSNGAVAKELFISEGAVEKHVSSIFAKFSLMPADTDHRRVLAVLHYLEA